MTDAAIPVPREIARANQHDVKLIWDDETECVLIARDLRLKCPCAVCVDELTGQVRLVASTIPDDVHPLRIDLVGRYAMSVQWSDGHNTGIYSFEKLREFCNA